MPNTCPGSALLFITACHYMVFVWETSLVYTDFIASTIDFFMKDVSVIILVAHVCSMLIQVVFLRMEMREEKLRINRAKQVQTPPQPVTIMPQLGRVNPGYVAFLSAFKEDKKPKLRKKSFLDAIAHSFERQDRGKV